MAIPEKQSFRIYSFLLLAVSLVCVSYSFWMMMRFAPRARELTVEPPAMTKIMLSPAVACILPVLAVICVIKEVLIRNRIVTTLLNGAFLITVMMVFGLWMATVLVPLLSIMQKGGMLP